MNGLRSFLNYLEFEKRYSPHTLEAYQNDLLQLQDFLSHTYQLEDLKEVQALHLRAWLVALVIMNASVRISEKDAAAIVAGPSLI